jgi:hypothetical protein
MIGSGAWTLRSDSVTSPSKAASRQSGQQAIGRSRSALLAKRNQRVSGSCSFWNAGSTGRSRMYQQMPEQQEGAAPASSDSAIRIRIRPHPLPSPSTTRLRLHRRLRARTGAVQVDVGVAGAVRAPCSWGAGPDGPGRGRSPRLAAYWALSLRLVARQISRTGRLSVGGCLRLRLSLRPCTGRGLVRRAVPGG